MRFLLVFIVVNFFTSVVYCSDVLWNNRLEGTSISGGILEIMDGDFMDLSSNNFIDIHAHSYIRLGLTERSGMDYLGSTTKAVVQIKITPYDNLGVQQAISTQFLEVTYSIGQDQITIDAEDYMLQGIHKFTLEVLSISVSQKTSSGWVSTSLIPSFLYLEAGFSSERYYKFNASYIPTIHSRFIHYDPTGQTLVTDNSGPYSSTLTDPLTNLTHEIELSWDYVPGSESYELEWVWVDNYEQTMSTLSLSEQEFAHNSTRVRLSAQHYSLTQSFSKGYLIYRVRGVGRWTDNVTIVDKEKFGEWSSSNGVVKTWVSNWPNVITISTDHEGLKNWQYQATYAEEGKKKEVVQYFDGSLRNRQTVTKVNSKNQSVVGETIYDNEGRGVIQILPVPQDNPALIFYPSLNNTIGSNGVAGDPYNFLSFDVESQTPTSCAPEKPLALDPNSGAAKYYSTTSHVSDQDWQKNVPDADGYPYTQVVYTPDNRGKIRSQSGVGTNHTIGSGHETFYYYLQPSQEELNRLFGYKVGYKQRYKKNMVVDANGQVSVSYLDAQGRVIATALTGDNTSPLETLNSSPENQQVHTDLLNKIHASDIDTPLDENHLVSTGRFGTEKDALRLNTQLGVSTDNTAYSFKYSATSSYYHEDGCGNGKGIVNYPYVYDLTISIKDDCGNELFSQTADNLLGIESVNSTTSDILTKATGEFDLSNSNPSTVLPKGSYTVYKELRVNQSAYENYLANYLSGNETSCLNNLASFTAPVSTDCETYSCAKCLDQLGSYSTFKTLMVKEVLGIESNTTLTPLQETTMQALYDKETENCVASCVPISSCDSYYEALKADVMPNGQYGSKDPSDGLSIFNDPLKWKSGLFKDEYGNAAQIEVKSSDNGVTYNFLFSGSVTQDAQGKSWISPNQLTNLSDFFQLFQPSWADALVKFHPEYPLYLYTVELCTHTSSISTMYESSGTSSSSQQSGVLTISSEEFDSYLRDNAITFDFACMKAGANPYKLYKKEQGANKFYGINFIGSTPSSSVNNPTYLPIYSIDPYFLIDYSSIHRFTSYSTINNTLRKKELMLYAISNYQESGLSMLEYAIRSVMGGYNFSGLDISNYDTWQELLAISNNSTTNILTENQLNLIWKTYTSYYLSEKARINQLLLDMYGFSLNPGLYNGAIGNGDVNAGIALSYKNNVGIGNTADFNSIYIDILKLTGFSFGIPFQLANIPDAFGGTEFDSKELRIGRIDLVSDNTTPKDVQIQEMQAKANYAMWKSTGLCPLTISMESFLNQLAVNDELIGTTPWNSVVTLTPDLLKAITNETLNTLTAPNQNVEVHGLVNGTNLSLSIAYQSTQIAKCVVTLPQINNFLWSNYGVDWHIYSMSNSYTTNGTDVKILVKAGTSLSTAEEYVITYTSCINVNTCQSEYLSNNSNDGNCKKEKIIETDLLRILQKLNATNQLYTSGVSLSNYSEYSTSILPNYLGTTATWDGSTASFHGVNGQILHLGSVLPNAILSINGVNIVGTSLYVQYSTYANSNPGIIDNQGLYSYSIDNGVSTTSLNLTCSCLELQPDYHSSNIIINGDFELGAVNYSSDYEYVAASSLESNNLSIVTLDDFYNVYTTPLPGKKIVLAEQYTIASSLNKDAFSIADHTSGKGKYMIVDAKEQQIIWSESVSVQPGKTYNFSSYLNHLLGNWDEDYYAIKYYINGVEISNFNLPYKNWSRENDGSDTEFFNKWRNLSTTWVCPENINNVTLSIGYIPLNPHQVSFFPNAIFGIDDIYFSSDVSASFSTPCIDCPPSAQAPISCTNAYDQYTTYMTSHIYIGTDMYEDLSMTKDHFCDMTYGYISEAYLGYLSRLGITQVEDPNYLTLSEFGSTPIGYNKSNLGKAVLAYQRYRDDIISDDPDEILLDWQTWIKEVYSQTNTICPVISPTPTYSIPTIVNTPCNLQEQQLSAVNAQNQYEIYLKQVESEFKKQYIAGAISSVVETFEMKYSEKEYHYTLYYYDRAGNLIETVPPKGVDRLALTDQQNTAINTQRNTQPTSTANGNMLAPQHSLTTDYRYNSLNQLVYQKTPDGGESRFAYDDLGRLVVSQNAKQFNTASFSYTEYDQLGRVIEVGELADVNTEEEAGTRLAFGLSINEDGKLGVLQERVPVYFDLFNVNVQGWTNNFNKKEVTRTKYDELSGMITSTINGSVPIQSLFGIKYRTDNTRNRIVGVVYQSIYHSDISNFDNGTFYDYDVHGNVIHLIQVNNNTQLITLGQNIKHIEHEYDLVSGNVNKVIYQRGQKDQFIHRYQYDADNRITIAETSNDNIHYEKDAKYFYYDHGPLARTELGERKVQAEDYAYTIQGWLKAVNGEKLNAQTMMGKDGASTGSVAGNLNTNIARDAFGYSLNYFAGDYTSADVSMLNFSQGTSATTLGSNLYNGNINSMFTTISDLTSVTDPLAFNTHKTIYSYDQLNRIKSMNGFKEVNGVFSASGYNSSYSFDANGNLTKMLNNSVKTGVAGSVLMDDFTYNYKPNTNQLTHVNDAANSTDFDTDIDGQGVDNYGYDAIGQLIKDNAEHISSLEWTVTNKVKKVIYNGSLLGKVITFDYDALGHRIAKHVTFENGISKSTYYVLDAQGNTMSTYEINDSQDLESEYANKLYLADRNIYGSKRVGTEQVDLLMTPEVYIDPLVYPLDKLFENTSSGCGVAGGWYFNEFANTNHVISDVNGDGKLDMTVSHAPGVVSFSAQLAFDVVVGKTYKLEYDVLSTTNLTEFNSYALACVDGVANFHDKTASVVPGHYVKTFVAEPSNYNSARIKWENTITNPNATSSFVLSNIKLISVDNLTEDPAHIRNLNTSNLVADRVSNVIGDKRYSLENHLSSTLMTVSDRKIPTSDNTNHVAYFEAQKMSFSDYGCFGDLLNGRHQGEMMKFGFNGKKQDFEISGEGNIYDYGFRIYNARLGKFLSVDPLTKSYPWYTPYQFAGNKPTWAIDLDGLEEYIVTVKWQPWSGPNGVANQYKASIHLVYVLPQNRKESAPGMNDKDRAADYVGYGLVKPTGATLTSGSAENKLSGLMYSDARLVGGNGITEQTLKSSVKADKNGVKQYAILKDRNEPWKAVSTVDEAKMGVILVSTAPTIISYGDNNFEASTVEQSAIEKATSNLLLSTSLSLNVKASFKTGGTADEAMKEAVSIKNKMVDYARNTLKLPEDAVISLESRINVTNTGKETGQSTPRVVMSIVLPPSTDK